MENFAWQHLGGNLNGFAKAYPHVIVDVKTKFTDLMRHRMGRDFDLLQAMSSVGQSSGEVVSHSQILWDMAPDFVCVACEPCPLTFFSRVCVFSDWGIESLEISCVSWQLKCVSDSHGTTNSLVRDGFADRLRESLLALSEPCSLEIEPHDRVGRPDPRFLASIS